MLLLFERHAQVDGKPVNDLEKLLAIQKRAMEELERRPNWSAMWKIHECIAAILHRYTRYRGNYHH